jgi:hypothetical protein
LYQLDLQGNRQLSNTVWNGRNVHVIPNTDDDAIENIASLCRVISRRSERRRQSGQPGEILYAMKVDAAARFNAATGELHLREGIGLTCSTFVLIVFLSARVPLIDLANWPARHVDAPRHAQLVTFLTNQGGDPAYIARVQGELPCSRVAPEEVAGAGMNPDLITSQPANQAFAERAARWILGLLDYNGACGLRPC